MLNESERSREGYFSSLPAGGQPLDPKAQLRDQLREAVGEVFFIENESPGDQVTIERLLPLATLTPGKYTLEVNATDSLSKQTILRTAEFTVKAPPETKTAANATPGR